MDELNILSLLRNNLYNYKYLLQEYDYYTFVETVINETVNNIKHITNEIDD